MHSTHDLFPVLNCRFAFEVCACVWYIGAPTFSTIRDGNCHREEPTSYVRTQISHVDDTSRAVPLHVNARGVRLMNGNFWYTLRRCDTIRISVNLSIRRNLVLGQKPFFFFSRSCCVENGTVTLAA